MATKTLNYELAKPDREDFYNIDVFNENADKIDAVLKDKSDVSHLHDDRYYTERETDERLALKSDAAHLHDNRYYTKDETDRALGTKSNVEHLHDDRYYTEAEANGLLDGKVDKITGKGLSANDYTSAEKDKLANIEANANKYVHPSGPGYGHIPAGGVSEQYLKWASNGTPVWADLAFKLVSQDAAGLAPALSGSTGSFLRGDGKWAMPPDTKYTLGSFGITATADELNFCDGVTGNIQTQLNSKASNEHVHTGVYEPAFSKNSAFNKNFGTAAGTVCQGNDARLSDARLANGGNADTVDGKHAADLQNYNNLTNKPSTFPPSSHNHTKAQITDFPTSLPANGGNADTLDGKHASDLQNYNNLTNKPSSFPPSGHTHTKSQITDFPTSLPANGGTASYSNYLNTNNIAASTNLNNLTTPGFYYCPANATVATLTNSPTANAFFLIVGKHAGVYQEIVEYVTANPKRFMRNNYSGSWGNWYRVFTTGNVPTYAEVGAAPSVHTHDDRYFTESEVNSLLAGKAASNHNHSGVYEPAFNKNNAFNKSFGTAAGTVCQGNDARLSDARTPKAHTHSKSQITDFPASLPANGGNADTVDGFHASQAPGSKSAAVVTNSSGYLMAGYINTNVSVENPAIGAVFVQNSAGDGYIRKASLAHLKTALKVGTVYVQAAQPSGLANGDLWFKTITI